MEGCEMVVVIEKLGMQAAVLRPGAPHPFWGVADQAGLKSKPDRVGLFRRNTHPGQVRVSTQAVFKHLLFITIALRHDFGMNGGIAAYLVVGVNKNLDAVGGPIALDRVIGDNQRIAAPVFVQVKFEGVGCIQLAAGWVGTFDADRSVDPRAAVGHRCFLDINLWKVNVHAVGIKGALKEVGIKIVAALGVVVAGCQRGIAVGDGGTIPGRIIRMGEVGYGGGIGCLERRLAGLGSLRWQLAGLGGGDFSRDLDHGGRIDAGHGSHG